MLAEEAGTVEDVSAEAIVVRERTGKLRTYKLKSSGGPTRAPNFNQKPVVDRRQDRPRGR